MAKKRDISSQRESMAELLHGSEILSSEAQGVSVVSEWADYFEKRYGLALNDVLRLAKQWQEHITVPVTAFSPYVGGLEAVAVFLRDVHKLKFSQIARMLARDPRTVWTAYRKAKGKLPYTTEPKPTPVQIPISLLSDRRHTVLEQACAILKSHYGLSNHRIASALGRSDSFVWTTLKRHEEKEHEK